MNLYLFKYCLPLLLGYALFVGLSGRLNPFHKPEYAEESPSWFLGLWTGLSVTIVMMVGSHMAYSMSVEGVRVLLLPTALFMAVLLTPGFLVYLSYRRQMAAELQASRSDRVNSKKLNDKANDPLSPLDTKPSELNELASDVTDQAFDTNTQAQDAMKNSETIAPVVGAFLDSADLQTMDTEHQVAANNQHIQSELTNDSTQCDELDETIFEEFHYSALDLDASTLSELSLTDALAAIESDAAEGATPSTQSETEIENARTTADAEALAEIVGMEENFDELSWEDVDRLPLLPEFQFDAATDIEEELLFEPEYEPESDEAFAMRQDNPAVELNIATDVEQYEEVPSTESAERVDNISEHVTFIAELEFLASDLQMEDSHAAMPPVPEHDNTEKFEARNLQTASHSDIQQHLTNERVAHEKTARQLYATRKVLAALTSGTEGSESEATVSFLQMKDELAHNRSQMAALQANVQLETSQRQDLESVLEELKKDLVASKQDVRRSTAARAKALSTANKAIAFARQTLQVRSVLENELEQARDTLSRRQSTISSLINELEQEKERTQEEVSYMVQQLVMHEQQLKARRNQQVSVEELDDTLTVRKSQRVEPRAIASDR